MTLILIVLLLWFRIHMCLYSWSWLYNTMNARLCKYPTVNFLPIWLSGQLSVLWLHLCNECPGYDFKQSVDKDPTWDIRVMGSTPLLTSQTGSLRPGVVAPDTGETEQTVCKQMTEAKLCLFYSNTWKHLTECKKISGSP